MPYKDILTRNEYAFQRPCVVCKVTKLKSEFNKYKQTCKECSGKGLCNCYSCGKVKHISEFPKDKSQRTGRGSKCKKCKNRKLSRKRKTKRFRTPNTKLREFFKDCLKRLNREKHNSTWNTLGFTKDQFNSKFPTIPEGMTIDHCIPISWFKSDTPIHISCSIHNLQLLSRENNSIKSNYFYDKPSDNQYFEDCKKYISEKYLTLL